MGYESKLYVVEKGNRLYREEKRYCQVIAMFDLCKFYPVSSRRYDYPATECYFYADDGDTQVLEDRYGDPLKEMPIEDVIDILENEVYNGSDYRRIYPILAALQALEHQKHQWGELAVLHYGY